MSILKEIEFFIKKIINRLILRGKSPIIIDSPQLIFSGEIKILILRQDRIGDLIISSSIIRILRNKLPKAKIDIVLSHKNVHASLCIKNFVDKIYIYKKKLTDSIKLLSTLRKNKYDLIIDMLDNPSTTSGIFLKLIKSKFKLGFDKENNNIYTHIVPLKDKSKNHIIDRISLILLPFDVNPTKENLIPYYPLNNQILVGAYKLFGKSSEKLLVAINVSGSDRSKYIGMDNIKELISLIEQNLNGVKIILFHTLEYTNDIEKIAKNHSVFKAPIFNDFDSYANHLAACDIIITPDTSAVHLASAFKKPCIALYKGLSESSDMPWYPYHTQYVTIETNANTISDISPKKIFEALKMINESLLSSK